MVLLYTTPGQTIYAAVSPGHTVLAVTTSGEIILEPSTKFVIHGGGGGGGPPAVFGGGGGGGGVHCRPRDKWWTPEINFSLSVTLEWN